jgi:hypothetical protein
MSDQDPDRVRVDPHWISSLDPNPGLDWSRIELIKLVPGPNETNRICMKPVRIHNTGL